MTDFEARDRALTLANETFDHCTDEEVVRAAERFYKFLVGSGLTPRPETEAPAPKLRTLIGFYKNDDGSETATTDSFAYEVEPGKFVWESSRAKAEGCTGWKFPNKYYRFINVETGEEVTS